MAALEFGVTVQTVASADDFRQLVRRADELGYDVLAAPDHLGFLGPFSALASAAALTERLRLRTYVLNASFWNAALLAREVATLDVLSAGRVELGVGAGHMKHEYDDAELPWRPLEQRIRALGDLVLDVRRRLADENHTPQPVQRPVPLMIGAMSERGLALAAEHADIVGFAGLRQLKGKPVGTFTLASAAETAERVDHVRRVAAGRPYRSDILLQAVLLVPDPAEQAAEIARANPHVSAQEVLDCPFVLLATDAEDAARQLDQRADLYEFDSVTTHQSNLETLGQVMQARGSATGAPR